MNEDLRDLNKNNTRYYIFRVDNAKDYEDVTRKGYVNWPFAIESGSTEVTHLPTGKLAARLYQAKNFTEAKKLLDLVIPELQKIEGADLETEEGMIEIGTRFLELCRDAKIEEKTAEPGNDFITCEYRMITGVTAIRRQFTKEGQFLIFDFPNQRIKIDKKTFNSFLTTLGSSAIIQLKEIVDKELITERLEQNRYRLKVVRREVHRCLKVEYQVGGIHGTAHFPEVK